MERLWTWITVWTLICSLTGFAPHCECYYFPLPLSNNSGHNERVWQKVKCLVINSFNWKKKRGKREREVPLQEHKAEGLEEAARLKSAWRPIPRSGPPTKEGRLGLWLGSFSKINDNSTLNTLCPMPLTPGSSSLARSYFGGSLWVAWI